MTLSERREALKQLNGAVTNTFGYLDLIQDPTEKVDRDECVSKAHACAKRALRMTQELLGDAWQKDTGATMTMQDVRERCYDARQAMEAVLGYIDLGNSEKAVENAKRVDNLLLKTLIDATEATKGTPDYKPNPF